jgi:hypothetical protein
VIDGSWDVTITTPIGRMYVTIEFSRADRTLEGVARGKGEDVALLDITEHLLEDGDRVTWKQRITKPMRLNLDFDVTVTGDTLEGVSKAGRLPPSRVSGTRLSQ